jgi:hypothetical protein
VTAAEGADGAEVPIAFVARTVNVYAVPFASPVTVQPNANTVEHVRPPGDAVTT